MTDLAERRGLDFDVYGAAEDSALLAGVAAEHVEGADLVLDVGTGSGYVGRRLAEETGARVIGSDVNPTACRRARDAGVESVRADLTTPFLDGAFDAVVFNPPYLPTDPDAEWDDWYETALSGGETGRMVIERFLDDVGRVLAPEGSVFLLVSTYTGVEAVVAYAGERGFHAAALEDATFPGETLTVLRLWRRRGG
jgi:release factor glutamine methyltransferase